jgi:hypothetical protein
MTSDERTTALLEDLRKLGEPDARDRRFREGLAQILLANAVADAGRLEHQPANSGPSPRRSRQRLAASGGRRFGALAAPALALVVFVLAMGFLLGGRGGASAEALLRRAAAITFEPNQARHLVYDVTMTLPGHVASGTGEIWIATDAAGKPVEATETLRLAKSAAAPHMVVERDQQSALGTYTYDGTHNTIVVPSRNDPSWTARNTSTLPLPVYLFDGATVAQRVADLAAQGAAHVQLLPERTIDGVTVDAVQVDGWPNGASIRTTLYFDAGTHLLRGFDSQGTDPSYDSPVWRVRLSQQTSGPRATAPADALALDAPPSAQVDPPPPAGAALPRLCGRQPKLLLASGQTVLDVCHTKHPGLTEDALVNALVGSAQQDLTAAVKAGAITRTQADGALQAQRAQIIAMLTTNRPLMKVAGQGK